MRTVDDNTRELFSYLRKRDISQAKLASEIAAWDSTRLLDFVQECLARIHYVPKSSTSIFDFVANSSLGGGSHPCAHPQCRLRNVDDLARFAILYADHVYIPNPFEKYVRLDSMDDIHRLQLIGDIAILLYLKPLFDTGLVSMRKNIFCLCNSCLAKLEEIEDEVRRRLNRAARRLEREYTREITVRLTDWDGKPRIDITGPENLLKHGDLHLQSDVLPLTLKRHFESGKEYQFTKRDMRETGLLSVLIDPIVEDIFSQSVYAFISGCQYLTNRDIDLDVAMAVNGPEDLCTSKTLLSGLSHAIPTVYDVELAKLIQLRRHEEESFRVYRDTIRKSLDAAQGLTVREARQLFEDEVRPALNSIELSIKNARKLLVSSLRNDSLCGVGFIAIGLFAGFLPPEAGKVLATLGGFKFASGLWDKATRLLRPPDEIRESRYYFLWRVSKLRAR